MEQSWSMDDAQQNIDDLIKSAREGKPQFIENNGERKAVLLSPFYYKLFKQIAQRPGGFVEFLLSAPKLDDDTDFLDFDRDKEE